MSSYDSSDDESIIDLKKREFNDTGVGAKRHIGRNNMDALTKTVDDDDYYSENVRRERAYQWHARWALPTYKEMKAQVRKAKGNLDITEEDVDLLPWGPGGMLNRREYERLQKGESTMKPRRKPKVPTTISINVQLPDGRTITLDNIKPDHDTAGDLRAKIQQKEPALEAKRQVLMRDGEKLPVGETCNEMRLGDGDTISLNMKKVPVTVTNKANGRDYTIMVDPFQPVAAIKEDLEGKTKMPVSNQLLTKDGVELKDDIPAADYGIQGGSKLELMPNSFPVKITMPDGKKIKVDVGPQDTADDIKRKIQDKTGMDAGKQVLSKKDDGVELPSGKTVAEMGIHEGDALQVDTKKVPIKVRTMDGDELEMLVDPETTTVGELKRSLEDESGIPAQKQALFKNSKELSNDKSPLSEYGVKKGTVLDLEPKEMTVKVDMPDGRQVPVRISPRDTSDDIKQKIEEKTGMPAEKQVLKKDGNELPSGQTAKDMGVRDGDNLQVEPSTMNVKVTMPDGSKVPINVHPDDTADDIKRKIEDQTGLEAPRQVLKDSNGRELPDGRTAGDLGLNDGDDLNVDIKQVPIKVRTMDGDEIQVMVDPLGDTIGDIKDKLEGKSGIPASNQKLFKDGKELAKDKKKADDYGIGEGTVLDLEPKSMQVMVEMPDGRKVPIVISPNDTSDDIKHKIEQKTGMEPAKQILKKDGRELPDGKAARDMGMRDGDNLQVEPKTLTMNVTMPDGRKVPVDIKPSDKADDIKRKIEDKTGMEAPRQVLKDANGRELPNGRTAQDLGLQDGDDLNVGIKEVPVTVRTMDGDEIKVMVDPLGDSLGDLKNKLTKKTGLPANNQRLFKDGTELDKDRNKLDDYGVGEGTVLDLEPKSMNVRVLMPNGKKVPLVVAPSDTADDIKQKIEQKSGMPANKQVLKMFGDEVPDNKTAKDMGLREGDDNLEVDTFKVPVTVNLPNGRSVDIMVDPEEPLEAIKRELEPASGIPVRNQNLYKQGKLLDDNTTPAGDYGIKAGTVLDLEDEMERLRKEQEENERKRKEAEARAEQLRREREAEQRRQEEERRRREEEDRRRREREEEERRREEEEEEERRRREAEAERKNRAPRPNRPPPITMGNEPLERAYRWYTRIQHPHRTGMIDMVKKSPGIDIEVEHVDLLPWIKKGKILDFPLLAEMLEEIVAKRKAQGLPF